MLREAEALIRELREAARRNRQERNLIISKFESEKERTKRLAAELTVLNNVRRQQDEEAADLLMQLAGSTSALAFVQKDIVLLRCAWNDLQVLGLLAFS